MFALSLFSSDAPDDVDTSPQDDDSMSMLSNGARIEGTLEFSSVDLRIEGTVHGDISTDGRVVVSEGAEVKGTIDAHTIRLSGYVEGHLQAENELVLCPPSEVHATINADTLEIQPGADFTGEVPDGEKSIGDVSESVGPEQNGADLSSEVNASENGSAEVANLE